MLRPVLALGAHHFAFLRATFQGLDTRAAWRRYLTFSEDESPDLRRLEQRRHAMLADLLALAAAVGRQQPTDHPVNQARSLLAGLVRSPAQGTPASPASAAASAAAVEPISRALPSLDEFIEATGLDPDTYSQAEWLALYREQHGLHESTAPRPAAALPPEPAGEARDRRTIAERVRALGVLERVVGRTPQPQDALSLWLAAPTCGRLQACGWQQMDDLSQAVHAGGAGWWHQVPGLGQVRAQAIERWLAELHRTWQRPFPTHALDARARARERWLGHQTASAPDLMTIWPSVLPGPQAEPDRGGQGLRTLHSLPPGFDADARERIQAWLAGHRAAVATWRAYRKEAERLWWWCGAVRHCQFAALTAADLAAFTDFLQAPPAGWVNATPLPRTDPAWRPFRSGLSARSADHALRVVRSLLAAAYPEVEARLAAEPLARSSDALRKGAPAAALGGQRARSEPSASALPADAEGELSGPGLAAMSDRSSSQHPTLPRLARAGAPARRRALLLAAMAITGCSEDEALRLRVAAPGTGSVWALLGPGAQQRPIGPELQAMIRQHLLDAGAPPPAASPIPLLFALRGGVRRWVVRLGEVQLEPWPRLAAPRPWSASACRRSLDR